MLNSKRLISLCLVFVFLFTWVLFERNNYTIVNATPVEIIVDNTDAGFSTDGSTWAVHDVSTQKYGTNYLNDNNSAADPDKWAKWTPNISVTGYYDISMWWPAASDRPDAAPIEIAYSGGIDNSKTVNQKLNGGKWVYLGTFYLSQGTDNSVKLLATDAGKTVADAVKFESIETNQYYVAVTGDDTNGDGTEINPWKTISRAMQDVGAGDTLTIKEGTYREEVILGKSGVEGNPITIEAANGANVTISGADPVTGWTQHSGNIYKASIDLSAIGDSRQIFADGTMMLEARWPNDADGDMNTLTGNNVDSGTTTTLVSSTLTQPNGYWNGKTVWFAGGMSPSSAQSATITSYSNNTLTFNTLPFGPDDTGKKFYMVGNLDELDTAGEWYYDASQGTLYLWAPDNANPNNISVEAKKRKYAFDISGKSYINIENIKIFSSTIYGINSSNCTIDGIKANYLVHASGPGANLSWDNIVPNGLKLIGDNNTIKNSEISESAFYGVYMSGRNLKVVNNLINNMAYSGASVSGLWCMGYGNLISHNTIHTCGRHVLNVRKTQNSIIQYNEIYDTGEFSSDSGVVSGAATDGWNDEIHHNKIYGNKSAFYPAGLYIDNKHMNFIIYQNVVYGSSEALRLNTDAKYDLVYNNTFDGSFKHWGEGTSTNTEDMTGVRFANNLFTGSFQEHSYLGQQQIFKVANLFNFNTAGFINSSTGDYRLTSTSPALDIGINVDGVTEGYVGSAPDAGAYERGVTAWSAGHNFVNPPSATYSKKDFLHMNRVKNSGFEIKYGLLNENIDGLEEWTKTGNGNAMVTGGTALYQGSGSLRLGGGQCGVEQQVTGLQPNTTYKVNAFAKVQSGEQVSIGVKDFGGTTLTNQITATDWTSSSITFTTGSSNNSATVFISKDSSGSGYAYADDIALIYNPTQPDPIYVDNTDSGFTTDGSTWPVTTSTSGFYGINYAHDNTSGSDTGRWAKWTPTITQRGYYKIEMRWTSGTNRPNAAPIEIQHRGGLDTSKTVNQRINGGTWVDLGTYDLSAISTNYVKILCSSSGYTIADAVRFTKVE